MGYLTPPQVHAPLTVHALEAGKHVMPRLMFRVRRCLAWVGSLESCLPQGVLFQLLMMPPAASTRWSAGGTGRSSAASGQQQDLGFRWLVSRRDETLQAIAAGAVRVQTEFSDESRGISCGGRGLAMEITTSVGRCSTP